MAIEQAYLSNRDTQTSDTSIYKKDLPTVGFISAIDIGIRAQNGVTSCINKDLLKNIKYVMLVANGTNILWRISGAELFRYQWLKYRRPMFYSWTEVASGYQEVWFRLLLGRKIGDPMYGLDLSRFNNVQVQIDYDMTVTGAIAGTTFTTGTFSPTIVLHMLPLASHPSFRGFVCLREIWTGTSAASGDQPVNMPSQRPILALGVQCLADNTAEGTDITDVKLVAQNGARVYVANKWYNLMARNSADLDIDEEFFTLLMSTTATKNCHLTNIRRKNVNDTSMTTAVA